MKTFSIRRAIVFAMTACFLGPQPLPADLQPSLDDYIEDGMKEWQLPGLSIAVVKDGETLLLKGYGVREAGKPEPVDENTLFAIGSATKAFTATALGILVDRGELGWNTRVKSLDPDLTLSDLWVEQEMRVSDLPSNHSGLSAISEALWYGSGLQREQIVERLRYVPFSEGFRYQYQYRNVMFLLGGMLVGKVAEQTWDAFIEAHIFEPLGMQRSSPTDRGIEKDANVAKPHIIDYENQPISLPYRAMHNIGPAGSIISCAKDLVPWLKVHLGQSEVKIVEPETLRYLHTSQTPMWSFSKEGDLRSSPIPLNSYCLGWVTELYQTQRIVWHNGNIDGMSAWVGLVPELGLGVAILSNLDDCELRKAIFYHIVDHYLDAPGGDQEPKLLERFHATLASRNEAEKEWQKLAEAPLESALPLEVYTGEYKSNLLGVGSVTEKEGRLLFERTPEQSLELVVKEAGTNLFWGRHLNPNEDLRSGKVEIEFSIKESRVTTLEDRSEGIAISFQRN